MSRVLIGQSYFLRFDEKLWRAMQPAPPLGSLWAAAHLREQGHDVRFFDAMLAESEAEWEHALLEQQPDVAVIFEDSFNYLSKMCLLRMREAACTMLRAARAAGCRTIAAGSDMTDNPAAYLDGGADVVIAGEGEVTLAEVLRVLAAGGPLDSVAGIVVRRDGELVRTPRRPLLRDLDSLGFPAWDLVDMERYRHAWRPHGHFTLNVATTRGCPFHCNWCAKPIWGQRYAVRTPAHVVEELAMLRRRYAPDRINIVDDIFGLKPGWVRAFAAAARARDVVTPFRCLSRADLLLRDGEIDALRDAGCEMVWMGAESGAQSVLDAMEKGTTVEQIREASARLRAAGIRRGFFLQFGYPGEGIAEIHATRSLVRECLPDDIGISVSYPLPGTRFFERVAADLGDRRNWVDSSDLAMLYRGPFSTRVYRRLHGVVHKELRLRRRGATTAWRGRARRVHDALTLPLDRAILGAAVRRELRRGARP